LTERKGRNFKAASSASPGGSKKNTSKNLQQKVK